MDRRQFLGATAGVAGAGSIAWLLYHFATRPYKPPMSGLRDAIATTGDVAGAYKRAFSLGKPVLVPVIPEDPDEKRVRGGIFGALLNHGGTGVYLDLALCEIACASMTTVREQIRGVEVGGEPLMLLVETDGSAARATVIDPPIPRDLPDVWEDGREKVEEFLRNRLDRVAAALREGVAPTRERLVERARLAGARLPAEESRGLRGALAASTPIEPSALDRGAAVVRMVAEDAEVRRPDILLSLAGAAAERVRGVPPAGAKWAIADGCGTRIEGEPDDRNWECGMGHVPELSRRFLWFFTK